MLSPWMIKALAQSRSQQAVVPLVEPKKLTAGILRVTEVVWQQNVGGGGEPMHAAWKRLFHEEMTTPLLFHMTDWEGRDLCVRLHPRGRVSVVDPAGGNQIRLKPRTRGTSEVGNVIDMNRSRIDRAAQRWIEQGQ